jgi:hypothetical protein
MSNESAFCIGSAGRFGYQFGYQRRRNEGYRDLRSRLETVPKYLNLQAQWPPVTPEVAGSSPVAPVVPAMDTMASSRIRQTGVRLSKEAAAGGGGEVLEALEPDSERASRVPAHLIGSLRRIRVELSGLVQLVVRFLHGSGPRQKADCAWHERSAP